MNVLIASRHEVTTRTYCYARQDMGDELNKAVDVIEQRIQKSELKPIMFILGAIGSGIVSSVSTYLLMR